MFSFPSNNPIQTMPKAPQHLQQSPVLNQNQQPPQFGHNNNNNNNFTNKDVNRQMSYNNSNNKLPPQQQFTPQNLPPSGPLAINNNYNNGSAYKQNSFNSGNNVNNNNNALASNNTNSNSNSRLALTNSNNNNQLQQTIDNLKRENSQLQTKIEYYGDLVEHSKTFENSKNLVDLKSFVKQNYKKFSELIDQLFVEKQKCENLEKKLENTQVESKENGDVNKTAGTQSEQQNNNKNSEQLIQQQQQQQNANQQFYLNKIKELEERNTKLVKDNETLRHENKKLSDQVQKKDFFREYDKMTKEVEGLRKQNGTLVEKIKQLTAANKK